MLAALLVGAAASGGCANLYHYSLADIDSTQGLMTPFTVMVNETGASTTDAAAVAAGVALAAGSRQTAEAAGLLGLLLGLATYGPKTGLTVFSDSYADQTWQLIRARCPGGQITGLASIRETRRYPLISGEIVKITGYCMERPVAPAAGQEEGKTP